MNEIVELVEKYGNAFRDLINAKVRPSEASIRKVLRLSKDDDWGFLCTAMDIIGDTCTAIDNFLRFGLDGPTKYNDVGETYLRLYGILSTTYNQQEAVLKLYQLINVPPSLKKVKESVKSLMIRSLRHKLCSHSTNYYDEKSNSTKTYVPIRMDLGNFNCTFGKNGRGNQQSIDLQKAIVEHLDMMIELMDSILEKAIKIFYKGQETNKSCVEFSQRLEDLRIIKKGGMVFQLSNNKKLIITMGH